MTIISNTYLLTDYIQKMLFMQNIVDMLLFMLLIHFLGKIQQQQVIAAYASLTLLCSFYFVLVWKLKITVVSRREFISITIYSVAYKYIGLIIVNILAILHTQNCHIEMTCSTGHCLNNSI